MGGWFLQNRPDAIVADDLWTAHLMFTSRFPSYRYSFGDERNLYVYFPQQSLLAERMLIISPLRWCDACQWWARMDRQEGQNSYQCLDCDLRSRHLPFPHEAKQYQE